MIKDETDSSAWNILSHYKVVTLENDLKKNLFNTAIRSHA